MEKKLRRHDFGRIAGEAAAAGRQAAEAAARYHEQHPDINYEAVHAWVQLADGSSPFARWAQRHAGFEVARYHDGSSCVRLLAGQYGYESRTAYTEAYARVLQRNGINASASYDLD